MSTWRYVLAVLFIGGPALAGCSDTETADPAVETDTDVERTAPDAEVEVGPEGGVDVDVQPETTPSTAN